MRETLGSEEHDGYDLVEDIVGDDWWPIVFSEYVIYDLLGFGVIPVDFV
jgi:hypothetical protein